MGTVGAEALVLPKRALRETQMKNPSYFRGIWGTAFLRGEGVNLFSARPLKISGCFMKGRENAVLYPTGEKT